MKKPIVMLFAVLMLLLIVVGSSSAAPGVTDPQALADLAAVRQATAKYHDVNNALAAGYLPTEDCEEMPGVGGMGFHFASPGRIVDPAINMLDPEVLLYVSTGGGMKLVGVEYVLPIGPPDAPVPDPAPPAPVLFGQTFDGPMLGHVPGMPPHYDLHAWIWEANPSGIFAQWNPNVSCG